MNNDTYNYKTFSPHSYDFTKQVGLASVDIFPPTELTNLAGEPVNISDYFGKTIVLETGSITCPLYVGKIKSMNAVAANFPDVQFFVIYIREAHPGKKIHAHQQLEQKERQAQRLQQSEPENRTILIDTLDGKLHQKLGLLPNMAFIIGADGVVKYRADWNIPARTNDALIALQDNQTISQEPADFTPVPAKYSLRVLARAGGLPAICDFISHLPQLIKQHKTHLKNRGKAKG